jgi:ATP-dependent protease Clp ATPase subunit
VILKRRLACSFCGKGAAQVAKLVAGRKGYICDACAAEAHRIMAGTDAGPSAPRTSDALSSRIVARLERLWKAGQTFDPVTVV